MKILYIIIMYNYIFKTDKWYLLYIMMKKIFTFVIIAKPILQSYDNFFRVYYWYINQAMFRNKFHAISIIFAKMCFHRVFRKPAFIFVIQNMVRRNSKIVFSTKDFRRQNSNKCKISALPLFDTMIRARNYKWKPCLRFYMWRLPFFTIKDEN